MTTNAGRWLALLGALTGSAYALVWAWALSSQTYNVYGSLALVPVILAVNLLLIARVVGRNPHESWLPGVLVVGLSAKAIGTFARYWVAYVLYSGAADAERYNLYASYQHKLWRQGHIVWDLERLRGTQATELITTAIYTVIGGAPLAGFFVFASMAFWGAYLLYRAFTIALPEADHKRYSLLVFLLPSMLYWPSSIGKESWLLLFVGVSALGAARYFSERVGGVWLLGLGGVGLSVVRPHVAVIFFAALFIAQLFRPTLGTVAGLLRKAAGIGLLGIAGAILVRASAQFLGIDDLSIQAVSETVDYRSGNTEQGGSEFVPLPLNHPFGVPVAFATLLFRPLPFEANNAQMFVQSLEGVFLVFLVISGWGRLRQLPRLLRGNPFLWFTLLYVIGYTLAFAEFGNFGILARQRVLMLPFFLMLLSLPKPRASLFESMPLRPGETGAVAGDDRRLMATRR